MKFQNGGTPKVTDADRRIAEAPRAWGLKEEGFGLSRLVAFQSQRDAYRWLEENGGLVTLSVVPVAIVELKPEEVV